MVNTKKIEELAALVAEAAKDHTLNSWSDFVTALQVPTALMPALITGRTELLAAVRPRPVNEEECKILFQLISGLVKTNIALKAHAEKTAQLVDQWSEHFTGLQRVGYQVVDFANFRSPVERAVEERDE